MRRDIDTARFAEPHIDYLDRSARAWVEQVRNLIEAWVAEMPAFHAHLLGKRLRNRDDHHFEAAFFELYLHALMRGLGYGVRLHPRVSRRATRPDFLLTSRDGDPILLEAATVDELSEKGRAARRREIAVYDALNSIHCPDFFFHVQKSGEARSPIPTKRLRHQVTNLMKGVNYEELRANLPHTDLDSLPRTTFEHDGCVLEIALWPVSDERRGAADHVPIGVINRGASMINDHTPICDKLREKARKYGPLRRPLVIAINAAGRNPDHRDIMSALFGQESIRYSLDAPMRDQEPRMVREPNGAWFGPHGIRNTRVSAALVVSSLQPWSVAARQPVMYLNPWARYPVAAFAGINTYELQGNEFALSLGRPVNEILDLPAGWPGD